ncbi:MAG: TetR/AcrR family transcriptional regulator [Oscillospiraceae bacterium]|nr:TetR/AcrR family transcriptional regulator [Oscillospiraceae bacterium]
MEQRKLHTTPAAYRRQRQIEDCLFENLQHIPYHSISVSDLCRQVGISRKAFYNYYQDKDACFCAIVDRLIREAMIQAAAVPADASPMETVVAMLDFWKNQKVFFDVLIRNSLYHFFLLRNIDYVLQENQGVLKLLNTPEVHSDMDILACYVSSQITLVLQWYFRSFDTPTEEMARKLLRLLHVPMFTQNDA